MATLTTLVNGTPNDATPVNANFQALNSEVRTVAAGGTGAATLTSNGVLLGNGTSAVTATSAGSANQVLRVPAAGGTPSFSRPTYGVVYSSGTVVITSGTGEDDLTSYTLPAATLSATGMGFSVDAFGLFGGVAGAKTLKFYLGSEFLVVNPVTTSPAAVMWDAKIRVWWTSAAQATVSILVTLSTTGFEYLTPAADFILAPTWANSQVIKFTGECAGGGGTISTHGVTIAVFGTPT